MCFIPHYLPPVTIPIKFSESLHIYKFISSNLTVKINIKKIFTLFALLTFSSFAETILAHL